MPPETSSVLNWLVIAFGGLSAVAVIALLTYWLVSEMLNGPAESSEAVASRDRTSNTGENQIGPLE